MIDNILNQIYKQEVLDSETCSYERTQESEYYRNFIRYLYYYTYQNNSPYEDYSGTFTEHRYYFKYKNKKFILRVLYGQGTALQLWKPETEGNQYIKSFEYFDNKEIVLEEKDINEFIIKDILE
jgi:hypothetical protein